MALEPVEDNLETGHTTELKWGMQFIVKEPRYKNLRLTPELMMRLWHPEFPIVQEGQPIPDAELWVKQERYELVPHGLKEDGEIVYRKEPK